MDEGLSVTDASRLAEAYRQELIGRGRSEVTVGIYARGVRGLLAFAQPSGIVNRGTIRAWSDALRGRHSIRTAALYGVAVRRMLEWGSQRGECSYGLALAVPSANYDRFLPTRTITPEGLAKIEAYMFGRPEPSLGVRELRDRALFYYLLATAARVGEVLQLRRDGFEQQTVRQTQQRGGTQKELVPPPGVVALVREYLSARTDDLEWLWVGVMPSGDVTRLTDEGVAKALRRIADRAGVPRFKSFDVRHTAGVRLTERGWDLGDILAHFGARSMETVQRYRDLVPRSRVDEVRADLDAPLVGSGQRRPPA